MTKVIRGLCEFVREVADREAPLRWNELGKKQVERLRLNAK